MGRVLSGTLLTSTEPIMGRVLSGTLLTSTKPIMGRVLLSILLTSSEHSLYNHTNVSSALYLQQQLTFIPNLLTDYYLLYISLNSTYDIIISGRVIFICFRSSTYQLVKCIRLSLLRQSMYKHNFVIAMTKLYSPFKTHYSIQSRRVVSNITSINSFLKGGAPIPKSIKCSTDQRWKSSDISSSIKQGELDHSKDYFCIGCT